MFKVEKAKREKLQGAIALIGPSGAGKTLSALFIAYGIIKEKYPEESEEFVWSKIGVLDTEHKRSKIYADMEKEGVRMGEFQHIDFTAPYSPRRYDEGVKALKKAGAEVVIIDSLSHAWEGEGGLLDMQNAAGGTFQAWNKIKPDIQQFIKTLTQSDVHIIGTMRTKQDYIMEQTELGKTQIKKVGLKAIQKDDLEYEFQLVFQIDIEHMAKSSKDNSGMFDNRQFKITPEVGQKIYQWLEEGVDVKGQERAKFQGMLDKIHKLQDTNKNEELDKYIATLEKKANRKLDEFPIDFLEKAVGLIEQKVIELGGVTNVIQT